MIEHQSTKHFFKCCAIFGVFPFEFKSNSISLSAKWLVWGLIIRVGIFPAMYFNFVKATGSTSSGYLTYTIHLIASVVAIFSSFFNIAQNRRVTSKLLKNYSKTVANTMLCLEESHWPQPVKACVISYSTFFCCGLVFNFKRPSEMKTDYGFIITTLMLYGSCATYIWLVNTTVICLQKFIDRVEKLKEFDDIAHILEKYNGLIDLLNSVSGCYGFSLFVWIVYVFSMEVGLLYEIVLYTRMGNYEQCVYICLWVLTFGFVVWKCIEVSVEGADEVGKMVCHFNVKGNFSLQ